MTFSEILENLKKGKQAYRKGWNGKHMFVALRQSCEMTNSYIYIKNTKNELYPWQPSQEDMLSSDWEINQ